MMRVKTYMFSLTLLIVSGQNLFAQTKYSKLSVDKNLKDTFSFATKWDYAWDVFKDDSTGEFTRNDGETVKPEDTAHLFYTAKCSTNVQGGHQIRYCFANSSDSIITMRLSDGLPAYASEFYLYIQGDSFYFKPRTIYPSRFSAQKISYQVTRQKLTLNKDNYKVGEVMIGYVDAEFIETVSVPGEETRQQKFYLKGIIRTPLARKAKATM